MGGKETWILRQISKFARFFFQKSGELLNGLETHLQQRYKFCSNTNKHSGVYKAVEVYEYRRREDGLIVALQKEYNFTDDYIETITIENYFRYLDKFYQKIEQESKK